MSIRHSLFTILGLALSGFAIGCSAAGSDSSDAAVLPPKAEVLAPASEELAPTMLPPPSPPEPITDDALARTAAMNEQWTTVRVGGDRDAVITGENGNFRFGRSRVDTPLPDGYPSPTPPGAIELKRYPAVRRAEVSGKVNADLGMNFGFWPLFRHIQKRDIAMTSPVEMNYEGWEVNQPDDRPERWTMSFLYRSASLGDTGRDGNVTIVDAEPITVLAIGQTGAYRLTSVDAGIARLQAWLNQQDAWEAIGEPRALYYNDPSVPNPDKWMEIQLPVQRRKPADS